MKAPKFRYIRAETVEQVLALLDRHGDEARILAARTSQRQSTPLLRERTTSRAIAVVAPLELEIQLGGPVPGLGPLVMGL